MSTAIPETHQINKQAIRLAVRHYMEQIWSYKRYSIPSLVLPGIGSTLVFYAPPLVIAALLRKVDSNGAISIREALPYIALFGGLWLAGEILWRIAFYCLNRVDQRGMQNSYTRAMDELFKKDLAFFHNNFAGSLTKKTIAYSKSFEGFMDTLAFNIFAQLIPLLFAIVVLWTMSPLLVLLLIGMLVLVFLMILPMIKRRQRLVAVREAASNKTAGYVADIIGNMDAVKAFAHEDYENDRHRQNVNTYMAKTLRSWDYHVIKIDSFISPIYVLINVMGLVLAIWLGTDAKSSSTILVTFNFYAYATRILWEFNRTYRNLEGAITEAAQFTELLLDAPAVTEVKQPIDFHSRRGEVNFRSIEFSYANHPDETLFHNLNLHIAPGEKIALVGPSGGGKTTITKMLLRFVDVHAGEILIDTQNIAHARLKDLRSAISYVPQEPVMFHRTIRENIRYGNLQASDTEVEQAAKNANAHSFICGLPEGYETMVGERGVKLSGGQRQRIAIARAMIKDAPILVLDEATSALDSESEKLIQEALWRLIDNRTAIIIAHRLSTIQKVDRIVVLDDGKIVEEGSHKQLLSQKGMYATLWAHQSGGFIDD